MQYKGGKKPGRQRAHMHREMGLQHLENRKETVGQRKMNGPKLGMSGPPLKELIHGLTSQVPCIDFKQ